MLKEAISNWRQPVYVRNKRGPDSYRATALYVTTKLEQLVEL
jgi:hypothetical protein